ncbi:MAG: tetratricopeptide repeat protein [Parvibaculaceae bacterium]
MAPIESHGHSGIAAAGDWGAVHEGIRETRVVLAADLVGYTELVFRDPHAGVKVLRETRSILVGAIESRGGSILDTPGDFVLATFPDVTGAVGAAAALQQRLFERHSGSNKGKPGHWKIGIEVGDVFILDRDHYGTAINVAARLQALAGPGEFYLTDNVRRLMRIAPDFQVQDIGPRHLKNIDRPVHIYRAFLPAYEALLKTQSAGHLTPPKLLRQLRKPVVRLEPFQVINKSQKSALLAKALAEEVHLILSRISNSISVTAVKPKLAGAHDYVLSGTVQSGGPHLRVMTQLVSHADGITMWGERFECDLRRPFDVQEQIAREIVAALQLALTEGEQAQLWRRGTQSGQAWENFQRGHDFERRYTRRDHQTAIAFYRKSLEIDPGYLSAMVALAFCKLDEVRLGWTADPSASIVEAEQLCQKALGLQVQHADVQALLAFVRYFQGRSDDATEAMARAVELGSHSPEIIGYQGAVYDLLGDYRAAIQAYTRAISLTHHCPAWIPSNLGLSYLAVNENGEAERIYREVIQHYPDYVRAWIGLAASLNRQGKSKEAQQAAQSVLRLDPHFTVQEWAQARPFNDPVLLEHFIADLKATGLV